VSNVPSTTAVVTPRVPVPTTTKDSVRPRRRKIPVTVRISLAWLGLVVALAILQPVLPLPDPSASDYAAVRMAPFVDAAHLLGTDQLGRDMLARVISGAGVSLAVGIGATTISVVIGTLMGAAAGYFGGAWDRVVGWFNDVMLAFPMLIALIALTTFLGPSLPTIILGMGIIATPLVSRLARSSAMGYAQRDFVAAAKVGGASSARIIAREILPNIALVVIPFAITMVALAITAEGALSFLGLGVPPPTPSWGGIMTDGRADLRTLPHIVFVPATVMCVTLLAINFIADWVNRLSDNRDSQA
jgi:peptide/nickel transport system permease protein